MPSKQKSKGSNYERAVCKFLSELTGKSFVRTPESGARTGGKNFARTESMTNGQMDSFDGDILVPEEWNSWSIECKAYKEIAWQKLFKPEGEAKLNSWIAQANETIKPHNMVLFKINRMGQYIVIDNNDAHMFDIPECRLEYRGTHKIMEMTDFFEVNHKRFEKSVDSE